MVTPPPPRADPVAAGPGEPFGHAATEHDMGDLVGEQLDHYLLLEHIGTGGMGEVYLAQDVRSGRRYALKVPTTEATETAGFAERLDRQVEAVRSLQHPHLARFHGAGRVGERHYLVTEYVAGADERPDDLFQRFNRDRNTPVPEQQVRRWAIQIAKALASAHEDGLVHRALKPGNVLLDTNGDVKLTDLGWAEVVGEDYLRRRVEKSLKDTLSDEPTVAADARSVWDLLQSGSGPSALSGSTARVAGAAYYLAPEQRAEVDAPITQHTDIYALGVLLYRLLTARMPVGAWAPPSEVVASVPRDWDRLVRKCLAHDPQERYESMPILLEDLWSIGGLDDYRVVERIGGGGMGEVYRAEHLSEGQSYAIKVLSPQLEKNREFIARFEREAAVMRQLSHPRIVRVRTGGRARLDPELHKPVLEAGHSDEVYFLVMDYIVSPSGGPEDLYDRLARSEDRRLPEKQVKKWAAQVAEALVYAHANDVVHRDLKPGNILLDSNGDAKLTDFGLAKAVGQDFLMSQIQKSIEVSLGEHATLVADQGLGVLDTLEGLPTGAASLTPGSGSVQRVLGTYDYMSPEQRNELAGPADHRTDIYSFGVVVYRLLTGRRPVGAWALPSKAVRGLSKRWDEVVQRCLAYQPENRYQSAVELSRAIGGWRIPWRRIAALVAVLGLVATAWGTYPQWSQLLSPDRPEQEGGAATASKVLQANSAADRACAPIDDPQFPRGHGFGDRITEIDRLRTEAGQAISNDAALALLERVAALCAETINDRKRWDTARQDAETACAALVAFAPSAEGFNEQRLAERLAELAQNRQDRQAQAEEPATPLEETIAVYDDVGQSCQTVLENLIGQRAAALETWEAAERTRGDVESEGATATQQKLWQPARDLMASARSLFEQMDYTGADDRWTRAVDAYAQAQEIKDFTSAKRVYDERFEENRAVLARYAGDNLHLREAEARLADGGRAEAGIAEATDSARQRELADEAYARYVDALNSLVAAVAWAEARGAIEEHRSAAEALIAEAEIDLDETGQPARPFEENERQAVAKALAALQPALDETVRDTEHADLQEELEALRSTWQEWAALPRPMVLAIAEAADLRLGQVAVTVDGIERLLYVGETEVTTAQWMQVMEDAVRPEFVRSFQGQQLDGADQPIVYITLAEAETFCDELNDRHGATLTALSERPEVADYVLRLPIPGEWDALAGLITLQARNAPASEEETYRFNWAGPDQPGTPDAPSALNPGRDGVVVGAEAGDARFAAQYREPDGNEAGYLFHIFGNVWELCADGRARGGSWLDPPPDDLGTYGVTYPPDRQMGTQDQFPHVGLRVVFGPPADETDAPD